MCAVLPDLNVAFVMWRESVEALLVVGVLGAWLAVAPPHVRRTGRIWLWAGVAAGVIAAVAAAATLIAVGESLDDDARVAFQTLVILAAAAMIVQMTVWMRRHGPSLASTLSTALDAAALRARWRAIFMLAFLAVLREGSEAALFLYGTMTAARDSVLHGLVSGYAGLVAAVLTWALLRAAGRLAPWRAFFSASACVLLLLAGGLVVQAVDNLLSLGVIPDLSGRLWDASALLPDAGPAGGLIAALIGYRARPVLAELLALAAFWTCVTWLLHRAKRQAP